MSESDWPRVLGVALTGVDLGASGIEPADAGGVLAWLAEQGWTAEDLLAHRRARQAQQQPWPHPVPSALVGSWAQFGALLKQVRQRAGLDGLVPSVHQGPKVLGPAERRLLADKPPHHL